MKPLKALMVAVAASVVALAACGSESEAGGQAGGSEDSYRIGVSFYSRTIPMYVEMEEAIQDKADELGVEVTFAYGNNDAAAQGDQINNFITQQVDLILASPVDANALIPAYQEAQAAQIPIISVANRVSDESAESAYVGPDLVDQSVRTMERVIEGIGGSGNILAITGPPQIAFVQMQQQGWEAALEDAPDVQIVETLVNPDLSTSNAVDLTTAGLSSNPEINAIIASNDDIALGSVQVVREAGIPDEDIFIAGWDGVPAAIEAVEEGTYDLTLSQKAYTWGQIAMQTGFDWLEGQQPEEHRVPTPDLFVDKDNVGTVTEEDLR